MEDTLFERVVKSLTNQKTPQMTHHLSDFIEAIRKERYALTVLVEILSERIGELLEIERDLKNKVLNELIASDTTETTSGNYVFHLERSPDKVVFNETLNSLDNVITNQETSQFPHQFIQKKEVFILKRREFEKAILRDLKSSIAKKVPGNPFLKITQKI